MMMVQMSNNNDMATPSSRKELAEALHKAAVSIGETSGPIEYGDVQDLASAIGGEALVDKTSQQMWIHTPWHAEGLLE